MSKMTQAFDSNADRISTRDREVDTIRKCFCGGAVGVGDFICAGCKRDLLHHMIERLFLVGDYNLIEFLNEVKEKGMGGVGKCCLCCWNYVFDGYDPDPVVTDKSARCCLRCYEETVIPALSELPEIPSDYVVEDEDGDLPF